MTFALLAAAAALGLCAPASAAKPKIVEGEAYHLSIHPAAGESRGTVLLLHGGGWQGDLGAAADKLMDPTIDELNGWGYDVANLGYRGGPFSLEDAIDAFEHLRDERGPREPICIFGASAGAHLGLMVAAERDDVACVVDLLGPPDLRDFGDEPRSRRGEILAEQAFGAGRLEELSPVRRAGDIAAPVLIGAADCDSYTALDAQRELAAALDGEGGGAQLVEITAGDDVDLEHCVVDQASFDEFLKAARDFVGRNMDAEPAKLPGAERAADPAEDGEDESFPVGVLIGGAMLLAGLALGAWAWRR